MMKILKYFLISLAVLVLIAIIAIPKILNPNQYKDQIVNSVKKATGRDLILEGDMKLSLFPLEFRLPNAALSNNPGFGDEPFARVKMAAIRAQLRPLFNKQLVVEGVVIHGLTLNLVRDQDGKENWKMGKKGERRKKEIPATAALEEDRGKTPALTDYEVGRLEIRDASINWKDLRKGDSYAIRNLQLETGRVARGAPLDLSLSFDANYGENSSTNHVELKCRYQPEPEGFNLESLQLTMDESHLTGSAQATTIPRLVWNFDLELDQLDVDRYLPKEDSASAGQEKDPPTGVSPAVVLRGIHGTGTLKIGNFKVAGIRMSDLNLQMNLQRGLLLLGPNQARLYGGAYNGDETFNVREGTVGLRLDESFTNVRAGDLFRDMELMKNFSGTGAIQFRATASGAAPRDFKQSLSGSADLSLVDGKFQGVNLEKMIREAKALASKIQGKPVPVETKQTDETLFKKFGATFQISEGVARTSNLSLEGRVLNATGEGSANLIRETLDFKLNVTLTEPGETKGLTVPVLVKGTFSKPAFGVDWQDLAKAAGKKLLEKELKNLFDRKNKKK